MTPTATTTYKSQWTPSTGVAVIDWREFDWSSLIDLGKDTSKYDPVYPVADEGTAGRVENIIDPSISLIDEVEAMPIPPKNKYHAKVMIKKIRRGLPSICEEFES